MSIEHRQLQVLLQSLQLLAADFSTQVDVLPDFVHIPDELALTYSECMLWIDQLQQAGLVDLSQISKLKDLDRTLTLMSEPGNESLWTLDALRTDPEWCSVREQARESLALFGEPRRRPDSSWMTFINSRGKTRNLNE